MSDDLGFRLPDLSNLRAQPVSTLGKGWGRCGGAGENCDLRASCVSVALLEECTANARTLREAVRLRAAGHKIVVKQLEVLEARMKRAMRD